MSTSAITIGERFADRYRVERLLGRGGMGAVYAVVDEQLDEPVALKVLSERLARHEQALARFQREVRLARRVTSAHVARTQRAMLRLAPAARPSSARAVDRCPALPPIRALPSYEVLPQAVNQRARNIWER